MVIFSFCMSEYSLQEITITAKTINGFYKAYKTSLLTFLLIPALDLKKWHVFFYELGQTNMNVNWHFQFVTAGFDLAKKAINPARKKHEFIQLLWSKKSNIIFCVFIEHYLYNSKFVGLLSIHNILYSFLSMHRLRLLP